MTLVTYMGQLYAMSSKPDGTRIMHEVVDEEEQALAKFSDEELWDELMKRIGIEK